MLIMCPGVLVLERITHATNYPKHWKTVQSVSKLQSVQHPYPSQEGAWACPSKYLLGAKAGCKTEEFMHLGLFSFDRDRFFIQFLMPPLGKWEQVPRICLCCSAVSATFGFPSNSTECLHAQLQIQVLKSQDHCAKPGQVATSLQLKGSRETIWSCCMTSTNSWKASANLFPQHSSFSKGTHKQLPWAESCCGAKAHPRLGHYNQTRSWEMALSVPVSQKDI